MELFLANENMAFSIAFCFMVLVLILEFLSSGVVSGMLDGLVPDIDVDIPDADIPDVDIEVSSDVNADISEGINVPALSKLFLWAKSKVPMLVYVIIFLAMFCIVGFITQFYVNKGIGHYLPWFIIVPIALFSSMLTSRYISVGLSKIVFKNESTSMSPDKFVGHLATITVSTARTGHKVEARFTDKYKQTHYVFVEPEEKGSKFKVGEEVLLVRKEEDSTFKCIENELKERN